MNEFKTSPLNLFSRSLLMAICVLFAACLLPQTVFAQDDEEEEVVTLTVDDLPVVDEKSRKSLGIFPRAIPIYLSHNTTVSRDIDVVAIRHELIEHINDIQLLRYVNDQALHDGFDQFSLEDKDAFVQAEIDMSYAEMYAANMNYDTALATLERVRRNYHDSLSQYFEPKMVSRAEQVYAYTRLARLRDMDEPPSDELHMVRRAFMEMIRLAPHIILLEGRQPHDRVTFYNEAHELFMKNAVYRQTPVEDAQKLAQKLGLEVILFLRIVQRDDGSFNAEVDFYENTTNSMTYKVIPLDVDKAQPQAKSDDPGSAPAKTDSETGNETVSLFSTTINDTLDELYAALTLPEIVDDNYKKQANRFFLDMGMMYFSYMKHTTDRAFHTLGANIQVSYMFTEHFFARGGISISGVFRDKQKDLYDTFTTIRVNLDGGVSINFDWVRPYIAFGLEYSYSTPFAITHSVACKTFGSDDIECNDYQKNPNPNLFGFNLVLGANFGKDPFYLVVEGFTSIYVQTMSKSWLQVPLGATLGFQYRFK